VVQISRQSNKARASYSDLKGVAKRRRKKFKENKMDFEGAYLGKGLVDSAQIWNWRCPTPRKLAQKLCVFLLREF